MTSTEKRKSKRIEICTKIKFGPEVPPDKLSLVTDLSQGGICFMTNHTYNLGTKLYLTININSKSYDCEGIVSWVKRNSPPIESHAKHSIGIKFDKADLELLQVYNKQLETTDFVETS